MVLNMSTIQNIKSWEEKSQDSVLLAIKSQESRNLIMEMEFMSLQDFEIGTLSFCL